MRAARQPLVRRKILSARRSGCARRSRMRSLSWSRWQARPTRTRARSWNSRSRCWATRPCPSRPLPRFPTAETLLAPGRRPSIRKIDEYANAEDEYFRARSADLADLRDRVLRILSGATQQSVPAGTVLVALRPAAVALPRHRLEGGGGHRAGRRQPDQPCRHAGARPRRADGGRPRRRRDAGPEWPGSHGRRRARHPGGGAGRGDPRRGAGARGGDQEAAGHRRHVPAWTGQAAERRGRDGDDQRGRAG